VFGPSVESKNIGIGAALGGPLVLATIAYPIVGVMLLITGGQPAKAPIDVNRQRLGRDQSSFLLIFVFKIALGFAAFSLKPWVGWVFLAAYAAYTWAEVRHEGDEAEGELELLLFQRRVENPGWLLVSVQTLLALVVIYLASHVFVAQLNAIGPWLGIPSTMVALLLSPVATELPETMNAIIWIRQGKHRLALSNISGSMMVQATVPTALGLFFTPWIFDGALTVAAGVTAISVGGLLILLKRNALTPVRLAWFALGYAAFAVGLWAISS